MKLTKDQRHTAYIIMLAEYKDFIGCGFCLMSKHVFGLFVYGEEMPKSYLESGIIQITFEEGFPELYARRKHDGWYWWDNWMERKEALKQCIEETYDF